MCVVSMVMDHYADKWRWTEHPASPTIYPYGPQVTSSSTVTWNMVSQAEFDKLKEEVAELKALLAKARDYDERTGQPECEDEGKVALLRKVIEALGLDPEEVLGK